jgi:hypothetical protein
MFRPEPFDGAKLEDDGILEVDEAHVREGAFPGPETIAITSVGRQIGGRRLTDGAHVDLVGG